MNLDAVVVEDEDIRSVDELLAAWPEVWQKFDAIVGENKPEHLPVVQDMLRTNFEFLLELMKSDVEDEQFDQAITICMKIVEDDRILPTHGEIIAIVAFSLQLFTNLSESHSEKCNDYIEKVLKKIVSLILGLAVIPTFGKKVKKEGEAAKPVAPTRKGTAYQIGVNSEDSDEDDGEEEDGDEEPSDEDSRLFVWNQCVQVILNILESDEHRSTVAAIANTILVPVTQFIKDSDYIQLKVEASELLEQLCILAFTPSQFKTWEALQYEENPLNEFLNEEEEAEEIDMTNIIVDMTGQVHKDDSYCKNFPYYVIDNNNLSSEKIKELLLYLLDLNNQGGEMAEVTLSSVIGVLTSVISRLEREESLKILLACFDAIKKQINEAEDTLEKISILSALKEIFVYSPAHVLQTVFLEMFQWIEGGRGGGGGGGRGRGRGGGGPPKVDPEKEMQFKVLQRQLAATLESLFVLGGSRLFEISEKFFNVTSTELSQESSKTRPDYEAQQKLLSTKLEMSYKAMSDNLGSKFVAVKSKLEGCRCLARVSSCVDENGNPVFPSYLLRTLNGLLEVANKDAFKIGTPVFVHLEQVIMANKKSEVLHSKIPEILTCAQKYLKLSEAVDGKEEDEMEDLLQLVACELIGLIIYQSELKTFCVPFIPALAPLLSSIIQVSGDTIKNFREMEDEEDEDEDEEEDDECPELIAIENEKEVKVEEVKEEKPKEEKDESNPPTEQLAALSIKEEASFNITAKPSTDSQTTTPTGTGPITFNFTPQTQPTTGQPNFSFNFNSGATTTTTATQQSFPKFDFGSAKTSPFVAPSFNFGSSQSTATTTSATSLGGASLGGTSLGGTSLGAGTSLGGAFGQVNTQVASLGGTLGQPNRPTGGNQRGRGNAGRGRGRVHEIDYDDDEDDDEDDDDDDDEDDEDDDDLDDLDDEDDEDDPLEHELSLCVSALSIVQEIKKLEGVNHDDKSYQELLSQSVSTIKYLNSTEYAYNVKEFLEVFDIEEGEGEGEEEGV